MGIEFRINIGSAPVFVGVPAMLVAVCDVCLKPVENAAEAYVCWPITKATSGQNLKHSIACSRKCLDYLEKHSEPQGVSDLEDAMVEMCRRSAVAMGSFLEEDD